MDLEAEGKIEILSKLYSRLRYTYNKYISFMTKNMSALATPELAVGRTPYYVGPDRGTRGRRRDQAELAGLNERPH